MKTLSIVFSLALLVLMGCSSGNHEGHEGHHDDHDHSSGQHDGKSWQGLHDEVMTLHDEAMAEMGTMQQLKKRLQAYLETLNDEKEQRYVQQLITDLENADTAMMDWMAAYEEPTEEQPDEEVTEYLEDQKIKAEQMHNQIMTSIKNANLYIKANDVPKPE